MGFLSSLAGIAAPIVGNMIAPGIGGVVGGALGGLLSSKDAPKSTQTNQTGMSSTVLDPHIAQLLGTDGGKGILGGLGTAVNKGSYLSNIGSTFTDHNALDMLKSGRDTTDDLVNNNFMAPTIQAAQVHSPSQGNINLSGAYNNFINGKPGENKYLDQSISGAIAQNRLGFQQLQDDSTKNLMQNVLPSIRSNSVLSGQYGGSRQGIAEGNAIGTQQTELARAAAQFGQGATNAAVGAKANAYETDSSRALAATQGLGAQQYGVAQQNAAQQQAANTSNASSLLATQAQNSSNQIAGTQLQQGIMNTAANFGNADLSRLGMSAGVLAPFMGAGSTTTQKGNVAQPIYQNTAGNVLGGAMLGGQLAGQFGGLLGGGGYTPTSTGSMGSSSSSLGSYNPSTPGGVDWTSMNKLFS